MQAGRQAYMHARMQVQRERPAGVGKNEPKIVESLSLLAFYNDVGVKRNHGKSISKLDCSLNRNFVGLRNCLQCSG
eukprot:673042-Hanusia_phi.AAC.2